ncbi:MAG: glycosyl hydrolase 108 family protein [Bacteroidia bacterium]|jgi:lysozyme family protein
MIALLLKKKNASVKKRTMGSFTPIWKGTKGFEGGYQQLANDSANYCPAKGKPGSKLIGTKFGISAIAYGDYFQRCPTVEEIKNLTPELAQKIAKTKFWDAVQGDKIKSQPVAHLVFDSVYGSGSYGPLHTRQAINKLMGAGTVQEYKSFELSDNEVEKINSLPDNKFFTVLSDIRKSFFKGLTYEKGYLNRMAKIVAMYSTGFFSDAEEVVKEHKGGVVIGITVIALGIGAFFLIRHLVKKKSLATKHVKK